MVVTMRLRVPLPEEDVADLGAYYRERLQELLPFHLQALERYEGIEIASPINVAEDRRWRNFVPPDARQPRGGNVGRWGRALSDEEVTSLRDRYRAGEEAEALAAERQRSSVWIWRLLTGRGAYAQISKPITPDEWRKQPAGRPKGKKTIDDQTTA